MATLTFLQFGADVRVEAEYNASTRRVTRIIATNNSDGALLLGFYRNIDSPTTFRIEPHTVVERDIVGNLTMGLPDENDEPTIPTIGRGNITTFARWPEP